MPTASWSISAARIDTLKEVLKPLNYKNLDEVPEFKGNNTTTEFLTKYIFDRLAHAARAGDLGRARPRTQRDPRHASEVACGARILRGAVVVKRVAFAVPGDLARRPAAMPTTAA